MSRTSLRLFARVRTPEGYTLSMADGEFNSIGTLKEGCFAPDGAHI
jgi:hypothetical protein